MRITRYRLDIEKKWKQIDRKMTHKTNSGWKKLVKDGLLVWRDAFEQCTVQTKVWELHAPQLLHTNRTRQVHRELIHRQTKQREAKRDQNELRWGQYSQCIHTFMCIKEDILTDNRGQEGDKPSLTDTYTDSSAHNRRTNIHTHIQAMRKRARNIIAHMHTYVHTHRDTQTRRASLAVSSSAPSWLNVVSHIN